MECTHCGAKVEGDFCPYCGSKAATEQPDAKNTSNTQVPPVAPSVDGSVSPVRNNVPPKKKPFYKRWWFIALVIVAVLIIFGNVTGNSDDTKKIDWSRMELGQYLPKPKSKKGMIWENSDEELHVDLKGVSDDEYADYVDACIEKGYTVDAQKDQSSYDAYNKDGYKLNLGHYGKEMNITLNAPMKMETIEWPTSAVGKLVPVPKSTKGKFSYESEDGFYVYIGETAKDEYAQYVKACSAAGFNIDYDKGDDYYYAENSDGYHLSLHYEGNNIMSVKGEAPDEEKNDTSSKETTSSEKEKSDTPSKETTSSKKEESAQREDEKTESKTVSKKQNSVKPSKNYQTIYNEYAKKIKDAAPTSSINELAEIANEGVSEMAEYMLTAKGTDGQYATYEEWSGKLLDVYLDEAR